MNVNDTDYIFKVIIIGDSGVGKSSLLLKYTRDKFDKDYNVTIGVDFGSKLIEIPSKDNSLKNIKLQIRDTAGQEKFRTITKSYYRGCAAAIIVFDVTCKESFNNIYSWIKTVREECSADTNIVLIGNKIDKSGRIIEYDKAVKLARKNGIKYFETSAMENESTSVAFNILAQDILNKMLDTYPKLPTGVRECKDDFNKRIKLNLDIDLDNKKIYRKRCCIK